MPYLIDGHNLIASLPDIHLDDPDDEMKLVIKLRGFAAGARKKCVVVFDSGLPAGRSKDSTRGVTVIFAAAQRSSADALIKRRINQMPDPRNWTLVSSDRDLRNHARRRAMNTMTAADFARRLQRAKAAPASHGEEIHPAISAEETAAWLAAFGAADD